MSVSPELEQPQIALGGTTSDAVTFSFGDAGLELYGLARLGLTGPGARPGAVADQPTASGLVLLFRAGELVTVSAQGEVAVVGETWESIDAAGLRTAVEAPLERWTVGCTGDRGTGFALGFEALGPPAELDGTQAVSRAGGMQGYEQICRVSGVVTIDGHDHRVQCLGQRGHSWGSPDWDAIEIARTVGAWLDDDLSVTVSAIRPVGAKSHADELVSAFLAEGSPLLANGVDELRLSTTYDADGRQRRASLELWPAEESDFPRRVAGELTCGTTLDLGRLRLDCAFFRWHMEGREGVGRYDIVRRA